jgi:hypothetical protein
MHLKPTLILALLFACCLHNMQAQYTITGKVTDANGQPLGLVLSATYGCGLE